MKLKIDKNALVYGLGVVVKATSTKNTIQALSGIEMIAKNNSLHMRGTDLEIELTCVVPAEIEDEGKVIMPGKNFFDLAKTLPAGDIFLESSESKLVIGYGFSQFEMNCYDPDSFPKESDWEDGKAKCSINVVEFQKAIKQVLPSISKTEERPMLTGIHMKSHTDGFSLISTDGHRVSWRKISLSGMTEMDVVLPGRMLAEMTKLPSTPEEEMEIAINKDKSMVSFQLKEMRLSSRLMVGNFPDCSRVIPKKATTKFEVGRLETLGIAERCLLVADESKKCINITTSKQQVEFRSASDLGQCLEKINIEGIEGEDIALACDSRYLIDGLKLSESEKVSFAMSGKLSPVVVRPIDDPNLLYLFLPLNIQ